MRRSAKDMQEFQRQLEKGSIQKAYRGLLAFIARLQRHFKKAFPDARVSALYRGAMDYTFFALLPPSLAAHDLKIAIVFNYDAFRFEAWLAGRNRDVQREYWERFKKGRWPRYRLRTPGKGVDAILECDLTDDVGLDDPDGLTTALEKGAGAFVKDVERFLAEHA